MKRVILIVTIALFCIAAKAQNSNERISAAMNSSDFFGLHEIYHNTPKDSIHPFLEVFSRCLIGNRFNRPDISIPAFDELLKTQSNNLDLNLLLQSSVMYSMDLSRAGKNQEAYDLLSAVLSTAYQMVDSVSLAPYANMAAQYKSLTQYSPYQISFTADKGIIPFDTIPAGNTGSKQYLMHLTEAQLNGNSVKITFDTGAGVNVITDSLARAYGLEFLDADVAATGVASSAGKYAMAKELVLGNIKIRHVPFYVINISSHNEKADKYINLFELIVGSELMLQLKDVTIDFSSKEIQVPVVASEPSNVQPNICLSSSMNLIAKSAINNQPLIFNIDSGDAGFGRLNSDFFDANKEYLTTYCETDTVNTAGVGGVWSVLCYKYPNVNLILGGNSVVLPAIDVQTQQHGNYMEENNLGLMSMMMFRKVRFNLIDMILTTEL